MSYHSLEDRLVKHFMRSGNFDDDVKRDMKGQVLAPSSRSCAKPLWRPTKKWSPTPRPERTPSRGGTNRMDAMKFFDRFRRTPKETTKGNRTLSASELLAREAKAEAEAAKATAARQPTGPNRLRTSEEFRAEQREKKKQRQRQNQIGSVLREVLSGEVLAREALVRQVPFMLYLCLLTILTSDSATRQNASFARSSM